MDFGASTPAGEKRGSFNQDRVIIALPFDRIGRVADDDLKGFLVPMLGRNQRIFVGDVELIKINIVQEHIDTAQVVGRQVDFLSEEALTDILFAQNLRRFQQQRAGAAGRVIDLVNLGFAHNGRRVSSSETSCGVKNSPPLLPALEAYILIRYSYASPNASIVFSLYSPSFIVPMPSSSLTSIALRFATVAPSLLLLTSISSNRPAKSSSLSVPFGGILDMTEDGLHRHVEVSSCGARARTLLTNNSDGRIKKPLVCTKSSRACSASSSDSLA